LKKYRFIIFILLFISYHISNASNFYWVGGSGNWNDLNHWATSSGGSTYQIHLPTANDHVIFDSLSFTNSNQTVTLNAGPFRCKNMNWEEAQYVPNMVGSSNDTLEIYGSLTFSDAMNNNFLGYLYFYSYSNNDSIKTNGNSIKGDLYLNGTGTYQIKSTLTCLKSIYLLRGTFKTNNFAINCTHFISASTSTRGLNLGSSLVTISGNGNVWDAGNTGFSLSSSSSKINFTYSGVLPTTFNPGGNSITYNVVQFASKYITFLNSGNYDTLAFQAGSLIVLQAQKNQSLNMLTAIGSCGSPIEIKSSSTVPATITNAGPLTITCNYLRLSLVTKAGANNIVANNSIIELAPCANWIVNPVAAPTTYYWINGNGNWSDPTHWSLSSGGATSNCIPSPDDNVVFNAASGFGANDSVVINKNAYCKNMTWTGVTSNPVFAGVNYNLNIKGNITLAANMTMPFSGNVILYATTNQLITSNGVSISADLQINKTSGELQLADDLLMTKKIFLSQGTFNTQNNEVTCFALITLTNASKTIILGTSVLSLTGAGIVWDMINPTILNGLNSEIICTNTNNNQVIFKGGGMIYNKLRFNNKYSAIFASNTYKLISLIPGGALTIQSNTIQTLDSLRCIGTCSLPITIESSSMYAAAPTISKTGYNTINISFVYLRNINAAIASPVRVYNATNSYGQYSTTGWNITNPAGAGGKKYWVGGTGNWSNAAHWSNSSGGPAGTCIPSQSDTVIFNAASFSAVGQTVTVDVDAYCKVMDWTGANFNPKLFLVRNLIVKRKATLNSVMQVTRFNRLSQIQFLPEANNLDFDSKKVIIYADVIFEGQNLTDSLKLLNHFYLSDTSSFSMIRGAFITNNDSINAGALNFLNLFPKHVNLGSSYIDLTYGWNCFTNNTLDLNAGTSKININGFNTYDYFYGDGLTYHDVTLSSPSDTNTFITGSNTFNNLTINPGVDAKFTAGTTQNINGLFTAIGNCTDSISLLSSSATAAIINKVTGTVNAECLNVKSINRTGAAVFNAKFSSNLGGVNGFNFISTPPASASFSTQSNICLGDTAFFTNTSTSYLNGPRTYFWDFGDGDTSTVENPTHIYYQAGTRIVKLITTLVSNQCTSTFIDTIHINSPFVSLNCNDNDLTICEGANIKFTASGLSGSLFQFTIDGVPTGPFSTVDTLGITTLTNGQTVAVNVSLNGCEASSAQFFTIAVNPSPVVTLVSSASGDSICAGNPILFTASGAHQYRFFIDGVAQGLFSSNNTFSSSNITNGQIISVVGKDTTSGCTRLGMPLHTITVSQYPVVTMTRSTGSVICAGTNVIFTASGASLYQFFINGIDQGPLSASNIFSTNALQTGDVVTVKGSTNNCLSNGISIFNFTVNPIPIVSLVNNSMNDTLCQGQTIIFQASGASTYQFFIDGISQGVPSGSSTFSSTIINNGQTITVQGSSSGCTALSNANTITVNPLPVVTLTSSDPNNIICNGELVNFTANGASSYEFFINGISQGPPSASNVFSSNTILNGQVVSVKGFSSFGCAASAPNTFSFSVLPSPIVNLYCSEPDTAICFGDGITFTANGALNYEYFVDGISQGSASLQNSFFIDNLPSGNPQVTVVGSSSNGCTAPSSTIFTVQVFPIPIINITSSDLDNIICAGTPVTFYGSGANQYQFFSNGVSQGPISGLDSLVLSNLINGQVISIYGTQNGCAAQSAQNITMIVNPIPTVSISSSDIDNIICATSVVNFTANGASNYQFSLNGNVIAPFNAQNVYQSDSLQTADFVQVQGISAAGCQSIISNSISMTVNPLPQVAVICSDSDTSICFGELVSFDASGANLYQYFVNGVAIGTPSITGELNTTTLLNGSIVTVEGTTNNGCSNMAVDTFQFNVNALPNVSLSSSDNDNKICVGDTVIFYGNGALSYEFFINGVSQGPLSSLDSIVIGNLQNFQVISLQGDNNGCSNNAGNDITMEVYITPDVNLLSSATDTLVCAGQPITFTATGANTNEFFIDGISQGPAANVSTFITTTLASGQVVSVVGTNVVCPANAPQTFVYTVIPMPNVTVTSSDPNNEICFGEAITFTATGADNYQLILNGIPQDTPTTSSTFILTDIENGDIISIKGINTICEMISNNIFNFVVHKMDINLSASPSWLVCDGTPIEITATGADLYQFTLNGNNLGAPSTNNVYNLANPNDGDLLSVTGTNNLTSCSQSLGLPYYTQVQEIPMISASGPLTICEGDSVLLSANDTSICQWQLNGEDIEHANSLSYFASESGSYGVEFIQGGIGSVWSTGDNLYGQLGDSSNTNAQLPVLVSSNKVFANIAAGENFMLAIADSGKVYAWGNNQWGTFGNGNFTNSNVPTLNLALANAGKIAAGANHSLVLDSNGTLFSFGQNIYGQLGLGNNGNSNFPQTITGLNNIIQIAAGEKHSLAIKSDGTVWAWGDNEYGQIGDGTMIDNNAPVQVIGLNNITQIACGKYHNLALDIDSNVWVWGNNSVGQLGLGTILFVSTPVLINLNSKIIGLAAGDMHSLILDRWGNVYSFGDNSNGQLGIGNNNNQLQPIKVDAINQIKAIYAGHQNSFALRKDGSVWVWGNNNQGQLGNGFYNVELLPVHNKKLTGAHEIAAGINFTCALMQDEASCSSSTLNLNVLPSPAIQIYIFPTYLSTDAGVSYQWYFNNSPILNGTNQTQDLIGVGNYFVQVTYTNGCISTSPVFSFQVGVEDILENNLITINPNPASDVVNIVYKGNEGLNSIVLFDCTGRIVSDEVQITMHENNSYLLYTSNLANGIYTIQIIDKAKKLLNKRLVVLH
jgi:alpha-tubulin suppressor-like RCC1 family protein